MILFRADNHYVLGPLLADWETITIIIEYGK